MGRPRPAEAVEFFPLAEQGESMFVNGQKQVAQFQGVQFGLPFEPGGHVRVGTLFVLVGKTRQ
jgi:hypothetical protein